MNTTELIEIARECCEYFSEFGDDEATYEPGDMLFNSEGLQQFAQRIEQPLLDRINRLVDKLNAKDTQIEQLREALQEAAFIAKTFIDGYEDLANSVGVFEAEKASIRTARKQLKALEKTK